MEGLGEYIGMNPVEPIVPFAMAIMIWVILFGIDRWILDTPYPGDSEEPEG